MIDTPRWQDGLLRQIFECGQSASPATVGSHPDEETLALFAAGMLVGEDRSRLIDHLAVCSDCRQATSLLMNDDAQELAIPSVSTEATKGHRASVLPFALAASIFLGVLAGLASWSQLRRLAEPVGGGEIALASAGRLTHYGVDFGGVAPRSTGLPTLDVQRHERELKALRGLSHESWESHLQRGYHLLSLDRLRDALAEFSSAIDRDPNRPLGWLGQGIAQYLFDDFSGAERSFRECLRLDPSSVDAQINLAMTLEEEGKVVEAIALWEKIIHGPLEPLDRARIEANLRRLQKP